MQSSYQFVLHWSNDGWKTAQDTPSTATAVGVEFADIQVAAEQTAPLVFTFYWPLDDNWQGEDHQVEVTHVMQSASGSRKVGRSE